MPPQPREITRVSLWWIQRNANIIPPFGGFCVETMHGATRGEPVRLLHCKTRAPWVVIFRVKIWYEQFFGLFDSGVLVASIDGTGVADGAVDALVGNRIVHPTHFLLHCGSDKQLKRRRSQYRQNMHSFLKT